MSFWGRHFPLRHWRRHFPLDSSGGLAPAGAATFALVLESGVTVTRIWDTGMGKWYDGSEKRSCEADDPVMRFSGTAILAGDALRAMRGRIARWAALGRPFLLGLPYEELTIRDHASGFRVPVWGPALARADWALLGGRVLIVRQVGEGQETWSGVITEVGADYLDVEYDDGTGPVGPGDVGRRNSRIMPAFAIFLEPQQSFGRFGNHVKGSTDGARDSVERWSINARNAIAGFASAAAFAELSLNAPTTIGGVLAGLTLRARASGEAANSIAVSMTADFGAAAGEIIEGASSLLIRIMDGVTTVGQLVTLINSTSSTVLVTGTWTSSDVLDASYEFGPVNMAGGAEVTPGEVGVGSVVNTYRGKPIWDRGIVIRGAVNDSLQSMTEAKDYGGMPFTAKTASKPDWGRQLVYTGPLDEPHQYAKRFLDTVKGRWKSFWLASWRKDLLPLSAGVGTLTVSSGENGGDLFAWWPLIRSNLQLLIDDATTTNVRITEALDNGDGTITLTIVDEDDLPVTIADVELVTMVSWLELCRLEKDEVPLVYSGGNFLLDTMAREVQQ